MNWDWLELTTDFHITGAIWLTKPILGSSLAPASGFFAYGPAKKSTTVYVAFLLSINQCYFKWILGSAGRSGDWLHRPLVQRMTKFFIFLECSPEFVTSVPAARCLASDASRILPAPNYHLLLHKFIQGLCPIQIFEDIICIVVNVCFTSSKFSHLSLFIFPYIICCSLEIESNKIRRQIYLQSCCAGWRNSWKNTVTYSICAIKVFVTSIFTWLQTYYLKI